MNVTHPCKQDVVALLDDLSPEAAALDAVNTVVFDDGRAIGHNTDASGFAESFRRGLPDAAARTRSCCSAPAAPGAAVAHAALRLGARDLVIVDVDSTARRGARAPARRDRDAARSIDLLDADGLIHATPTGMAGHPGLPLPEALLRPDLWVAEVVYRPLETELVQARARARLPHAGRRRDGGHAGRGLVRAVHRRRRPTASGCCATSPQLDPSRSAAPMKRSIATVCLSGTLDEKLDAAAPRASTASSCSRPT